MRRRITWIALALICAQTSSRVLAAPKNVVTVATPEADVIAKRGRKIEIVVTFTVAPGYHINSAKPSHEYMIPTRVEWAPSALPHLGDTFPPPVMKDFDFSPGEKLAVYQGQQKLKARFNVPENAAPGKLTLEGKLKYQACDDHACYPPAAADLRVPVEITAGGK